MNKKTIQGYEGLYEIYDDGRVWSCKRSGTNGRFLKHVKKSEGYMIVSLCKNNIKYNAYIHILVAKYFIPNPENKPTVDHIDRNKSNNHISNLRWATCSEQDTNKNMLSNNKTGFKGVTFRDKNPNLKWRAMIYHNHKSIELGCYATAEEASAAYLKKELELKNPAFIVLN